MEYTEGMYKQFDPTAQQTKVIYLKEFSKKWIDVDCKKSDNPEVCEKKTKAVFDYSVDLLKFKVKVDKCAQLIGEVDNNPDSSHSASICMNSVERAMKIIVDDHYQVFKDLDQI